jgi:putative tricarboxylic transport membrane protein
VSTLDRIGGVVLFLFAFLIIWESNRTLPLGSLHSPGPGYLPTVLALLLAGLSILMVLSGRSSPRFVSLRWTEGKHALAILAACGFAALVLERIGYRATMFLLLLFLLGVVERLRPILVLSLALGLSLGSFWVFYDLLRVPLPFSPLGY